jgi:hypothetical protein
VGRTHSMQRKLPRLLIYILNVYVLMLQCRKNMQFNFVVVYKPPSACTATLSENLDAPFKNYKHNSEVLFFWDFNINWLGRHCRKKLKDLTSKHDFSQKIKAPKRITRNTQTLIDLIFTNKPDRIIKTYYLVVTGLSDHNLTLVARKLTKKRLTRFTNHNQKSFKLEIPRKTMTEFENELKGINCDVVQKHDQVNDCCNQLTSTIGCIVD